MRRARLITMIATAVLAGSCQIPGPPVALDDIVESSTRDQVAVNVVANDFITGDAFAVQVVSGPSCGEITDVGPTIVVQVSPECREVLVLEYQIIDADFGESGDALLQIRLPFQVVTEQLATAAATPLALPLNPQQQEVTVVEEPTGGGLITQDGALIYLPAEGFRAVDSVALAVGDGGLVVVYEIAILHLTAEPIQTDFPIIEVGDSEETSIRVRNEGAVELPLAPLLLGEAFELTGSSCGETLLPGDACELSIRFAPESDGAFEGRLDIPYGNGGLSVGLTGAAGTAELYFEGPRELRTDLVILPPTKLGRPGEPVEIYLYNQSIIDAIISFNSTPALSFAMDTTRCPDELPGLERCPLTVALSGQLVSRVSTPFIFDSLQLLDPGIFGPILELEPLTYSDILANSEQPEPTPLKGTAVALGPDGDLRAAVRLEGELHTPTADLDLTVNNEDVDVEEPGSIFMGDDGIFTVRNTSIVPIEIRDVTLRLSSDSPADGFALGDSTCAPAGGSTRDLLPDSTCTVEVKWGNICATAWLEIVSDSWPRLLVKIYTTCVG
ncbi:MAG: choice-of-anchor D domain-containing protein [Acidimicrobiia bacterium]|nr:choice-of-anchor D domain-containing protein [Acidimicrobiia bacterium]